MNQVVIVGIDFGSSGSGFSYGFKDSDEIIHGEIYGANVDNKVPTEIILKEEINTEYNSKEKKNIKKYKTIAFGADCQQYIIEKGLEGVHYFKDIKMNLYSQNYFITAKNSEKSFEIKIVIQKVLEELKKKAIKQINQQRPNIKESDIKWVVTVPAIWQVYEKNLMMEACIGANLIKEDMDKSLFFALEPEAASYYCLKDKSIDKEFLKIGNCYIICDLGGGTGDIVTHVIGENKNLKEIYPASGGDYGSNEIDKLLFSEIIKEIFGVKDFNEYKEEYMRLNENEEDESSLFIDWIELERKLKNFKEQATLEKIKNDDKFPIQLDLFKEIKDTDIENLINKYNNKCDNKLKLTVRLKKKWIVEFPYYIIYNYIKKQAKKITEIINKIIEISEKKINSMILVGGYCSNEILYHLLNENLKNKIILLKPSKPCLAIMEGAVYFGLNPNKIIQRKAKYTIGMSVDVKYNEKIHLGATTYIEEGIKYAHGCFSKFIEINQDLKLNEEIYNDYLTINPRYCKMKFYKTLKKDPIFVNEDKVYFIGECDLDAGKDYPKGERNIIVTMKFGGTFINVIGKHLKSGNQIKTKLNFEDKDYNI